MSKKILKRSLALGALMAFVITGNAMAASVSIHDNIKNYVKKNDTHNDITSISITMDGTKVAIPANQYAIVHNTGDLIIVDSDFNYVEKDGGTATNNYGNVLYSNWINGDISIIKSNFYNNKSVGKKKSNIYGTVNVSGTNNPIGKDDKSDCKKLTITKSNFSNNVSFLKAGALNVSTLVLEISESVFDGNRAYEKGGAIYANTASINLNGTVGEGNLFQNNSAHYWGGAIEFTSGGEMKLTGVNTFEGNSAGAGGAISTSAATTFDFYGDAKFIANKADARRNKNITWHWNTSGQGYGGAILLHKSGAELNFHENVTFFKNLAAKYGGAIYANSGTEINFKGGTATFTGNQANVTFDVKTDENDIYNVIVSKQSEGTPNDIYNAGKINIDKDATVILDGGITGSGSITNDGYINLKARQGENETTIGISNSIDNSGEINIEQNVAADFSYSSKSVNNNGDINIFKDASLNVKKDIKGNGNINIDGGTLVANLVKDSNGNPNNIVMANGAYWETKDSVENFVNVLNMNDGTTLNNVAGTMTIKDYVIGGKVVVNSDNHITINKYSGNGTVELNKNGHLHVDSGSGTLNLTAENLTKDKFNDVAGKLGVKEDAKGIEAKLVIAEDDIVGETTGIVTYAEDEVNGYYHGFVAEENITEKPNTKNQALSDAGISLKLHWRSHMNDMNKRMGELRNANGEHGVWTRMVRGESEYKNTKAQYNQYQLGYDEKLSGDKRWTVGAAVTFAEGDANYGYGSTDDKSTAFAIYGTKLNDDGTFVDLIARYAHLESDYEDVTSGKGDYSTNGMSVSAEFGKRIQQSNGLWIEPQVELTYGTIDSAEFQLDKKTVYVGDMDSLIGRVGFSLGKDIKQGNVYARASYLYDFDGETVNAFSNGKQTRYFKEDLGGGWWEVGVGANINLSKATYVYADVEKTFGGEVDTNWQWNLGVRYSF